MTPFSATVFHPFFSVIFASLREENAIAKTPLKNGENGNNGAIHCRW
jgi:hypothetical protein